MQAIIPVAGAGTRLRPHTYTQPKALISVAGKPILSFIIDELAENGVNDFVFIVGYLGEKIREFVEKNYPKLKVTFVTQEKREGTGQAIWLTKEFIDPKKELIIHLGDTIVDIDIKKIIAEKYSTLPVKKVENPQLFGVAEINEEGFIESVVEKPSIPKANMALVGIYYIRETQKLFDSLDYIIKKELRNNNEFYLTDALMHMIKEGVKFKSYKVESWFDVGKKEVLLETNAILLKKQVQKEFTESDCEGCIIVPPVNIAAGVKLKHSIIGPNVSIGENTEINYAIIKNSIIGSFTRVEGVVLHDSLIGSDSSVSGLSQSLNIGDNTEIDLKGN